MKRAQNRPACAGLVATARCVLAGAALRGRVEVAAAAARGAGVQQAAGHPGAQAAVQAADQRAQQMHTPWTQACTARYQAYPHPYLMQLHLL